MNKHANVIRLSMLPGLFSAGFTLMAVEILGFRLIGKTFGSSLQVTSSLIAVYLTAMAMGHYLGGLLSDRFGGNTTFLCTIAAAGIATLFIPVIDTGLVPFIAASSTPLWLHPLLASTALFSLSALTLAAATTAVYRSSVSITNRIGATVGTLQAISTVGCIGGTMCAGFLLTRYFTLSESFVLLGMTLIPSALPAFLLRAPAIVRPPATTVIVLLSLFAPSHLSATEPDTVFETTSSYHHIRVIDTDNIRRLYFNSSCQSRIDITDSSSNALEYTRLFETVAVTSADPERILVIGLGGGSCVNRFLDMYHSAHIEVVELDHKVVDVAQRFFFLPKCDRLSIFVDDGRRFLNRSSKSYDIIVVDAYGANEYGVEAPVHMVTHEFFHIARKRLTPHGAFLYSIADPSLREHGSFTRAIYKTLQRSFGETFLFLEPRSCNSVTLSLVRPSRLNKESFTTKAGDLVGAGVIDSTVFLGVGKMLDTRIRTHDVPLLTDEYAPVHSLMRHEKPMRLRAAGIGNR